MEADFYRAFEERHYAPRETILRLRQQYIPFIAPLATLHSEPSAFDIGCGRGEWLEITRSLGFKVLGTDLSTSMLQDCWDRQLPAEHGDAIVRLRTLDDCSKSVISAFHVVEHIDFEELTSVVIESLRVLKPGGLMVLETPNPENIGVATSNFYLDPTHRRPIPPQLLSFLAGHYGFPRVKVLRLQEAAALRTETRPTLRDVIHGVSPDYAVIAQKAASPEEMQLFDTAFNREYGLPLDTLLQRFDERLTRAEQPEILRQRLRQSLPWRAMLVVRDRINRLLNQ